MKRLVTDGNIPYPMSTFERMLRYAKYGYFPCRETKLKIIKALRDLDDRKPKYIRFEGNDIFVSFDSAYWIYCGTLDEEEKEEIKRKSKEGGRDEE